MEPPAQEPNTALGNSSTDDASSSSKNASTGSSSKNNKKIIIILLGVVIALISLVALYLFMSSNAQNSQDTAQKVPEFTGEVVIGYNADQSKGPTAPFGVWGAQGFQIAVDEVNAKGGISGKKIRAVILDDMADKDLSRKNTEQLIVKDKVLAIIGPGNSANALNWIDLAQDNETIVITHIATATEITTKYQDRQRNYIFGLRNLDKEQVRLLVAFGLSKTSGGKMAIIHDTTGYGTQGVKDVTEVLARWGKTPAVVKSFERGTKVEDLVKIIKSAQSAKADSIVFYALSDSNADLLRALDQVKGYDPLVLGTAANGSGFGDLSPELAKKLIFTASIGKNFNEESKALNQKIINKFGKEPTILSSAASGYDVVYMIEAAVKKAGSFDHGAVRDALESLETYDGVRRMYAPPYTKQNHDALGVQDADLSHWVDGELTRIDVDASSLEIR